jgi:voltage-gated potassium channel
MIARRRRIAYARLRRRVHAILDSSVGDRTTRTVHGCLMLLVALSVVSVILESDARFAASYGPLFRAMEYFAVGIFTVEYVLRVWCAPEHTPYAGKNEFIARLTFVRSGSAIIDLLTILPVYLSFFIAADLRVFIVLRLLRFFKLARYSPGIRSLVAVMEAERRALAASAIILFGVVLFTAAAMHVAEHEAQPEQFGSIPLALWWAVQTVATVGYGDEVPITLAGRIIASIAMVMGFVLLGLPVGIVATAFAEEIHRREFVVTWSMVASVPLFASLDASSIAEIMRFLRAQEAPAGTLIVRRGEPANSMYFIAAGQVEVELPDANICLGAGQFFGEMAVLRKTRRTATVRALQATKLLVLDAFDLHVLIQRNPEIGRRLEEIAKGRVEFTQPSRRGDLIEAELETRDDPSHDAMPSGTPMP